MGGQLARDCAGHGRRGEGHGKPFRRRAAKGWDVAAEFVEPGNTALDDRRPAFQAVFSPRWTHTEVGQIYFFDKAMTNLISVVASCFNPVPSVIHATHYIYNSASIQFANNIVLVFWIWRRSYVNLSCAHNWTGYSGGGVAS